MSQVRSVCVDQCVSAISVVEVPIFCLCSGWNSDRGRRTQICGVCAEGCLGKWWGLCRCSSSI